jgi:hypothetical protein
MDLSFSLRTAPIAFKKIRSVTLSSILAESSARQAVTPTAILQAQLEKKSISPKSYCAVTFLTNTVTGQKQRPPASFNPEAATLITIDQ